MNKFLKKLVTLGLATIMIVSGSVLAFADTRSQSSPVGEGSMYYTVSCNGQRASAGMETSETSDSYFKGSAWYEPEDDVRTLIASCDQSVGCSDSVYQIYSTFYYAGVTFSASLNSGGYNSVFLNCN